MMQRFFLFTIIPALILCSVAYPAAAQWSGMFEQEEETPEPPQELPPLPEEAQEYDLEPEIEQVEMPRAADYYQQRRREFPPLPPASPCKLSDMVGIWRLLNVYEEPEGNE